MQYIYATDLHGIDDKFLTMIDQAIESYPNAQLIFGGDYIDRGRNSKRCLDFVRDKVENHGAIALKGNHEDMLINALYHDQYGANAALWLQNGGDVTVASFTGNMEFLYFPTRKGFLDFAELVEEYKDFLLSLKHIAKFEEDKLVFVHAGLDLSLENPLETEEEDSLWIREPYIYEGDSLFFRKNPLPYTIISGHTPTMYLDEAVSYEGNREISRVMGKMVVVEYPNEYPRIFADTCMATGRIGQILIIDDGEFHIYNPNKE